MPRNQQRTYTQAPRQKNKAGVTFEKLTFHKLNWLEWVAIVLSLWFLFYPRPYQLLLGILLIIPLLGLLLNGLNKPSIASLVTVSVDRDGDDDYDVADFIDFPAMVIGLRVLLDFNFESVYSMILPGIIACVIIITFLFLTHKRIAASTKSRGWIYASLIFCVSLYSVAATYAINCVYDYSESKIYTTEVLDKRKNRGSKSTTYYVKVAPWGHHHDKEEIRISANDYSLFTIGDSVDIHYKKGVFNIPWYRLGLIHPQGNHNSQQ